MGGFLGGDGFWMGQWMVSLLLIKYNKYEIIIKCSTVYEYYMGLSVLWLESQHYNEFLVNIYVYEYLYISNLFDPSEVRTD